MRDYSTSDYQDRTRYNFYNQVLSVTPVPTLVKQLISAPIVHGDHHRPNNHFFSRKVERPYQGILYRYWRNNEVLSDWFSGSFQTVPIPVPAPDYDEVYNAALSDLANSVRGSLDLSVDLAESHQGVNMIKAVHKAQSYLELWRPSKVINKYLEFTYGWKPLANSIYQAGQELTRPKAMLQDFHGRAYRSNYRQSTETRTILVTGVPCNEISRSSTFVKFVVTLGPELATHQLNHWASLNPFGIAWELMPYSFVVDWVYDVGGFLSNVETSFMNSTRFKGGYVTTGTRKACNGQPVWSSDATFDYRWYGCTGNSLYQTFSRSVLPSYPYPHLPSLKRDLGAQQVFNLGALAAQRVLGLKRAPPPRSPGLKPYTNWDSDALLRPNHSR